jgi:intraflagellar transport protein 172
MLITISEYAQTKLESLDFKTKSKFLRIISGYINRELASNQVKKLQGEKNLIRIRYNLSERIIASLLKDQSEVELRILDFVPHTIMDQSRYYSNIEGVYTILDLEQTEPIEADNLEELNLSGLWQDSEVLESILLKNSIENYFYLYSLIHQTEINPYLSLASDQYNLVQADLPIFLAGSAGSGKTTIAIYHAIAKSLEIQADSTAQKVAYITYNSFLKEYAGEIVKQICDLKQLPNFELLDYHNLEESLGLDREKYHPQKRINQHQFISKFCKPHSHSLKGIDPIYLWEEIRYHIKGSVWASRTETGLISWEEYQRLNHYASKQLYDLASQYQDWLQTQEYWDEIDSTHNLIRRLKQGEYKYDFLYCDEVQDLTAIQIHFLLKLLRPPVEGEYYSFSQFLFTGDTAQIINPSGFSWAKVRQVLYDNYGHTYTWNQFHKRFDKPHKLSFNFRSTEAIVNFSNKLLTNFNPQEAFKKGGEKPLIITKINPTEILKDKNVLGPNRVIITVNEKDKQELKKQFNSERVLSVTEVKGLEYNEVLVWNFFSRFDGWQKTDTEELTAFKNNCLYVCATRAREKLYFYEATELSFWQRPELKDYLTFSENKLDLEEFFNPNITSEDWKNHAEDLARQGAYLQAKENYQRGGWHKEAQQMEAKYQYSQGYKQEAADIYLKFQDITEAIPILEEINNYTQIAQIYTEQNEILKAAQAWEKVPNYQEALVIYEGSESWEDIERCAKQLQEWEKVAIACEHQQKWLEAGQYWQLNNQTAKAAYCYEQALAWDQAEVCWRELQEWEKVAIACEYQLKWLDAGQYWQQVPDNYRVALMYQRLAGQTWESLGDLAKAAIAYDLGETWTKDIELYKASGQWEQLAKLYEKQEQGKQAAVIWQDLKYWEKAAQDYLKAQDYLQAEHCWRVLESWQNVAQVCELQNSVVKWHQAALIWQDLNKWEKAAHAFYQCQEYEKAGQLYERVEDWQYAELCWQKTENKERLAIVYEHQAKWAASAQLWQELCNWNQAAKNWEKVSEIAKAAFCYEKAEDWKQVVATRYQLEEWCEVAKAYEQLQEWVLAADMWKKGGETSKAAELYCQVSAWSLAERCYEELEDWTNLAQVYKVQKKWLEAGQIWIKVPEYNQAGQCYENANAWSDAEFCWRQIEKLDKVANACEKQNKPEKWLEAVEIWKKLGKWEKAALNQEKLTNYREAAELFERGNCLESAKRCWKKLEEWVKVARICEGQELYFDAGKAWEQEKEWEKAARNYERVPAWSDAEICWRKIQKWDNIANACEKQNRKQKWLEAAKIWLDLADQTINNREYLTKAAQAYEKALHGKEAAKIWLKLGNRVRAIWAMGLQDITPLF